MTTCKADQLTKFKATLLKFLFQRCGSLREAEPDLIALHKVCSRGAFVI